MSQILELDVLNPTGLHARPAAVFVKACSGFRSKILVANVTTGVGEVNAKSILGVLDLGASQGHRIRLRIDGDDEVAAATTIRDLVAAGLGEPVDGRETSGPLPYRPGRRVAPA